MFVYYLTKMYAFQIDSRDREITRLNHLLTGGRPASALGKDCCYRDVNHLADDIDVLQKEKLALQAQLKESISQQHEAMQRAMKLAERNEHLSKNLGEMEKIALSVESEANEKLLAKGKQYTKLEVRLGESLEKIALLEADHTNLLGTKERELDKKQFRSALKQAHDEINNLNEKVNILSTKGM